MIMIAELKTRLATARTYCITKNNAEPKPSGATTEEWKAKLKASEQAYKDAFSDLDSAIDGYTQRASYDILFRLMQGIVMFKMMSDDPAPSLWQYYGAGNSFQELLAKPDSYFYSGVLEDGEKPSFDSYTKTIEQDTNTDEAKRSAAVMTFIQPMMNEMPRVMFSDYQLPTISRTKQENAQFVYGDAHAAEVIRDFNIEMWIPEGY